MCDSISENKIRTFLNDYPHLPVFTFKTIDSTNTFAKNLTSDYALVVSEHQSSGRGRMGKSFYSPEGAGIYMSLRVKIPDLYQKVTFITTYVAVAVHKAIKKLYNIDTGIKWVNDLYIVNKKIAGILCESSDDCHCVIGIGINVYPALFPEELSLIATHLPQNSSKVSRNELIGVITHNILSGIDNLPHTTFMDYYKAHSIVMGKEILCIQGDESFTATAVDINPSGFLIVKTPTGEKTLSTGEISIRIKAQNPTDRT